MEWRKCYVDVILVPLGIMTCLTYHVWLWQRVRHQPLTTVIGINATARRFWVAAIIKDNEKKNILAVQTLRNTIMGSTLMATTSILVSTGLAAVISSTYTIKKPLMNDSKMFGGDGHGELMVALKYVTILVIFLFSFLCHSISVRFINQVNFLINCCPSPSPSPGPLSVSSPPLDHQQEDDDDVYVRFMMITPVYVSKLLERGILLNTVGNRLFYLAIPLLLWIFGPLLVFFSSLTLVLLLYHLDIIHHHHHRRNHTIPSQSPAQAQTNMDLHPIINGSLLNV